MDSHNSSAVMLQDLITPTDTIQHQEAEDETPLSQPSQPETPEKFRPGWKLLCAFTSIAIVNAACALDATIISVALPVRPPPPPLPPLPSVLPPFPPH